MHAGTLKSLVWKRRWCHWYQENEWKRFAGGGIWIRLRYICRSVLDLLLTMILIHLALCKMNVDRTKACWQVGDKARLLCLCPSLETAWLAPISSRSSLNLDCCHAITALWLGCFRSAFSMCLSRILQEKTPSYRINFIVWKCAFFC